MNHLWWAAGFIEGEGTFYFDRRAVTLRVPQVQREPLERLQALFGGDIGYRGVDRVQMGRQPIFIYRCSGARAVGVAMTLYSMMSPGRKFQIRRALAQWRVYPGRKWTTCRKGHPYVEGSHWSYPMADKFGRPTVKRICKACAVARRA